jgi:hypothetical protein
LRRYTPEGIALAFDSNPTATFYVQISMPKPAAVAAAAVEEDEEEDAAGYGAARFIKRGTRIPWEVVRDVLATQGPR